MLLYRHSTKCPSAIQIFLDENPQYWRFVPMLDHEANQAEQNIAAASIDIKSGGVARTDEEIKLFIQNLSTPPANYRFSHRQYHQQYAYFQTNRDQKIQYNVDLDLYNAKIIAVRKCFSAKIHVLLLTHLS